MTGKILRVAAVVLLAGCGGGSAPAPNPPGTTPAAGPAAAAAQVAPGLRFEECAEKCGLRWRMTFLRAEQGENFRINLYDHGSGVCVADFDGDGHDDIYLVNELGAKDRKSTRLNSSHRL